MRFNRISWEISWHGSSFFWIHGNAPLSPAESRNRPTLRGSKTSKTRIANYFVYPIQHHPTVYIYILPIGSMVLLYMVTWIPSIYPLCVSIYTIHGSYGLLVGGLEHFFMTVHSVGNVIIPTDELIFFRGAGSTTNQYIYIYIFNYIYYSLYTMFMVNYKPFS